MKILALDSSGLVASVAVTDEDTLIAEYTLNYKKTHSQTLLPMLDQIKSAIDLDLSSIDAIAVAMGPGSFTGLRIGAATAKGLGLALDKPIIGVPTVDALAYNLAGTDCYVCPIMDARRNQVYTGIYEFEQTNLITKLAQCAIKIEELLDKVNLLERPVIFLGDGVPVFHDYIKENCKIAYFFAPVHSNKQRAASVASLGMKLANFEKQVNASAFYPEYLRLSQAERERLEK